ncbi:MAG: AAA-like domain-containing protein [Anaerolineales bacterium]|nr:AAA-like domain-containing protein [Anaerolineales bacterium]
MDGHPYLTRKALYLLASKRTDFDSLVENACEDDGPFGDHLRNHLFRMSDYPELRAGLAQIIKHERCSDEHVFFRLRGAGLAIRIGNKVLPRNTLYADYFGKRLND